MTIQLYKEIGKTLRTQRRSKDLTLELVAEAVGVSANYISELEKGDRGKLPSDTVLKRLSVVLNLDEKELFKGYGKIPLSVKEELQGNDRLLSTLYEAIHNPSLTDKDRSNLYSDIQRLYISYIGSKLK
ncbi:helix-turn-helix domain-containing protein [Bacillus cereus]|uniref:helix-turn-helix domain-containing protein n=1 Tax=Bacillus cereus TaxID=1396 RepID=UPI003D1642D9